jgi:hypothetical protein
VIDGRFTAFIPWHPEAGSRFTKSRSSGSTQTGSTDGKSTLPPGLGFGVFFRGERGRVFELSIAVLAPKMTRALIAGRLMFCRPHAVGICYGAELEIGGRWPLATGDVYREWGIYAGLRAGISILPEPWLEVRVDPFGLAGGAMGHGSNDGGDAQWHGLIAYSPAISLGIVF